MGMAGFGPTTQLYYYSTTYNQNLKHFHSFLLFILSIVYSLLNIKWFVSFKKEKRKTHYYFDKVRVWCQKQKWGV